MVVRRSLDAAAEKHVNGERRKLEASLARLRLRGRLDRQTRVLVSNDGARDAHRRYLVLEVHLRPTQGDGVIEQDADRGVFITTSTFTAAAREYARLMRGRMVTIDGARLTALMIRYHVGVQVRRTFDLVEVDEDFFD